MQLLQPLPNKTNKITNLFIDTRRVLPKSFHITKEHSSVKLKLTRSSARHSLLKMSTLSKMNSQLKIHKRTLKLFLKKSKIKHKRKIKNPLKLPLEEILS